MIYKGKSMVKKISKWVAIIPIKLVEYIIWPVAKLHDLLRDLSVWVNKKLS